MKKLLFVLLIIFSFNIIKSAEKFKPLEIGKTTIKDVEYDKVIVLDVDKYQLTELITVNDIKLYFYKDTLIFIKIDYLNHDEKVCDKKELVGNYINKGKY